MRTILTFVWCLWSFVATSQTIGDTAWIAQAHEYRTAEPNDGKFVLGFQYGQFFSTIEETAPPVEYFVKPSIGGGFVIGYQPFPFVSVVTGAHFQQQGAGIIVEDVVSGIGEPDSTYRTRWRVATFSFPIMLQWHGPKIFRGTRPNAGVALAYTKIHSSNIWFHSVEDGFHDIQPVTHTLVPGYMDLSFSVGLDVEVRGSATLQVHYVNGHSLDNVLSDVLVGREGRFTWHGLRLTTRF